MPSDTVERGTWKRPTGLEIPSDLDLTDLLIWEEEKRREQQRRDEAYQRLPLHAPEMPYRRPETDQENPERGVTIIRLYS